MVPIISQWPDALPYLSNLAATVNGDIRPLLGTSGGAPFAVSREVLSYVDHLGHLYSGKSAVGDRTVQYLSNVMSLTDQNYLKRAREIYQMYRCGPVHEFEPKRPSSPTEYVIGILRHCVTCGKPIVIPGTNSPAHPYTDGTTNRAFCFDCYPRPDEDGAI